VSRLRLGTRGSPLALAQARLVATLLGEDDCEIETIETGGDRGAPGGDKARWVDAIEDALLADEIDLAVHSAKDVPGELAEGLVLAGAPNRADPRDALVGAQSLDALPSGARVGTSSLRRRAALLAARPDLTVTELRGNVDTRLRKLAGGEADALVLAAAGLLRLGRSEGSVIDEDAMVPAPGQGTIALEARAGDDAALDAAREITHPASFAALSAERALVRALDATCHTPVGAFATVVGDGLTVRAFAGLPDGSEWVRDRIAGSAADPEAAGRECAERMLAAGAKDILERAEALA
jgi:hydroxymethylbilane synthase